MLALTALRLHLIDITKFLVSSFVMRYQAFTAASLSCYLFRVAGGCTCCLFIPNKMDGFCYHFFSLHVFRQSHIEEPHWHIYLCRYIVLSYMTKRP